MFELFRSHKPKAEEGGEKEEEIKKPLGKELTGEKDPSQRGFEDIMQTGPRYKKDLPKNTRIEEGAPESMG